MGMVEARVAVSGLVQGVWFRASTQDSARRAGAKGFVRNLPDGRVEAVVQGTKDQVDKVIAFMRQGPAGASVEHIEVTWQDVTETYHDFTIGYYR